MVTKTVFFKKAMSFGRVIMGWTPVGEKENEKQQRLRLNVSVL